MMASITSFPHTNPEASDDELKGIADLIQGKGFDIGSLVAPVWPGTVGDSAMGTEEQRGKFLEAVKMACRIAKCSTNGARKRGVIALIPRSLAWRNGANTAPTPAPAPSKKPPRSPPITANVSPPKAKYAGPVCQLEDMLDVLEGVGMPEALGFQADLAHTYLYTSATTPPNTRSCRKAIAKNSGRPTRR